LTSSRPPGIDAGTHTADDGLFGPSSVTWRSMAHPSTGLAASAAAMIQMLYPPVMHVVDQASHVRENPELRAQRTSDYGTTITYGDVAAAEKAGETLRRIHARCTAVDPDTGARIAADDPHLLVWVHNSLTWAVLNTWRTYGPALTDVEREQFVVEQKISARLVGCDPDAVAGSVIELEAYMAAMEPRLAFSAPCVWFKELIEEKPSSGGPGAVALKALLVQSAVSVMSDHHRALYGYRWSPLRQRLVVGSTSALLRGVQSKLPLEQAVGQLRERVDTHAFGSRRRRAVAPLVEPVAAG
jgi:uncharacterized protein (DUF2236 family)